MCCDRPLVVFFVPNSRTQVVGAVTKAAVGVAVGRAAATVSEKQGLPPPTRTIFESAEAPGAKRRAFASLLSSLLTFLRSDDDDVLFTAPGKVRGPCRRLGPGVLKATGGEERALAESMIILIACEW